MANIPKPENALKRAEELINVGEKLAALQHLHDLITHKRSRNWQKPLEKIMFKYIELCVDLRKGRFAKDGLIQYRNVCQQVNISSLEEVIKHFMHLSMERAELAKSQADKLDEALDVEDLEMDKRPEDLMISYVSGEKGKERSDREMVTPWFKFLWETYRSVLEILRNNSKLEALYAMTAHKAFQFCKTYKRTTEFRRLCEIIRNHLGNLIKYKDQRDRPDLTAPESLQLYLDTRMEQLKIATDLELWQEAFRSVEDIHGLMSLVKKTPKPNLLVIYFSKLTEIFFVSGSHLYHAYAWLKLFSLQKSYNKKLSQKDLQLIASAVLLAALAVEPYERSGKSHLELENEKERGWRMAGLINFSLDAKRETREVLSRESLMSELAAKGVMSCVSQEVKDLYNLLETEFLPLDLASKVQPLLGKISKLGGKLPTASSVPEVQLSKYTGALEKLTTLRVLQQASKVFQTMKIEMLSKMVPFFDFSAVEKISVDAVKYNFIAMKVDHLRGAVIFGNVDIESDRLVSHLSNLASSLSTAWQSICPPVSKQSKLSNRLQDFSEMVDKEHKRLLARKSIIEKRKEEHERQMLEMEKEEESKRMKTQKITEEAEKTRLEMESRQRERLRIQKEIEEKELREAQDMLLIAQKGKKKGKKPLIDGEVTKQSLIELALSEQLKERQEAEKRLQKLAKTMDYLERAKREQEAPLVREAFLKRMEEERVFHEEQQLREIELSKQSHAEDLQQKNRLSRMVESKLAFQNRITTRRQAEFGQLMQEREDRINQLIAMRKAEREKKRKLIFYLDVEEKRLAKEREEKEARKREEDERKKKEEAERKAALDAMAERQRQREQELEEKLRLERERVLRAPPVTLNPVHRAAEPDTAIAAPAAVTTPAAAAAAVTAPAAAAAIPAPARYVPSFRRRGSSDAPPSQRPVTERPTEGADRWSRQDERPAQTSQSGGSDRWRPGGAGGSRGATGGSSGGTGGSSGGESRLPSSGPWAASRRRG